MAAVKVTADVLRNQQRYLDLLPTAEEAAANILRNFQAWDRSRPTAAQAAENLCRSPEFGTKK